MQIDTYLSYKLVNTLLPGYDTFVLWNWPKTSSFRLPYQLHSSSTDCTRELFKPSNDSSSLLVCNENTIFCFWVSGFLSV